MVIGLTGRRDLVITVEVQQTALDHKSGTELAVTRHLVEQAHNALETTLKQYNAAAL